MTPSTYLLRVEGVNLDASVYDTRDLATIRGGSLILLRAAEEVAKTLQGMGATFKELSRGASLGLFEVVTSDPAGVANKVRERLGQGCFEHATFVVDLLERTSATFRESQEQALAANRWRQLQAGSLSIPALAPTAPGDAARPPACDRDGLRPALTACAGPNRRPERDGGTPTFLSRATEARRAQGRRAKQEFYEDQTGLGNLPEFANDFQQVAEHTHSGKLAVFYADGNGFGKLQQRLCNQPAELALWDCYIRQIRREFLSDFLQQELVKSDWLNGSVARFETLLWGGDELLFVMPAQLGWRFANRFFTSLGGRSVADARFPAADHPFSGDPTRFTATDTLTHTAALVFCQPHAPIDRIKHLAKDGMVEAAKDHSRTQDQLLCVALESFDHLGTSYVEAMTRRYGRAVTWRDMILVPRAGKTLGDVIAGLAAGLEHLRGDNSQFARSQLRGLVEAMLRDPSAGNLPSRGDPPEPGAPPRLPSAFRNASSEDARVLLQDLLPLVPSPAALWFQLEELWEYALP